MDVTLNVLDNRDDTPVDGATVTIGDSTKITGADGRVKFHSISPTEFLVNISKEGFEEYTSGDFTIRTDTSLTIRLDQLLADVKFIVRLDSANLYGATVTITGESKTTSSAGLANFYDLETFIAYPYSIEYMSEILAEDTIVLKADSTVW
ncbi:unnamed protein product, partial [marine sediment metagenome]